MYVLDIYRSLSMASKALRCTAFGCCSKHFLLNMIYGALVARWSLEKTHYSQKSGTILWTKSPQLWQREQRADCPVPEHRGAGWQWGWGCTRLSLLLPSLCPSRAHTGACHTSHFELGDQNWWFWAPLLVAVQFTHLILLGVSYRSKNIWGHIWMLLIWHNFLWT